MKVLFNVIFFLLPFVLSAQNVAINNDGSEPHEFALLDVSSTTKGVLFPRMSTMERTSIPGPAIGLTVFDIDTYTYWVYRGDVNGGWRELLIDLDKSWQKNGSNMYNLNNGNVGIGLNNPQEKLSINAANPTVQFLHSNVAKSFLNVTGNDFKLGTYNNNLLGKMSFSTKGVDRMVMDQNGLIGIGTATPSTALTINGTDPSIQIRSGDVNKGYLKTTSDDVILGTNSGNLSGNLSFQTKDLERMVIEPAGDVGIGTTNPTAKLEVSTTNDGQVIKINAADQPFMGIWENNGYRGYIGSYYGNVADIDVGSLAGAVHLVTGSTIDLTAKSGKIGIGTEDPEQLLEIHSPNSDAFARVSTGNSNQFVGLEMVRPAGSSWKIGHGNTGRLQFIRAFDPDFTNSEVVVEAYNDSFYPGTSGTIDLGNAFNRWATVYAVNGMINTSDARDKTNIQNIHYGLNEVMKLRPVSFKWKSDPNGGTKLGLIAQELKEVVNEVVVLGDNGKSSDRKEQNETSSYRYGVYYSDLIPVLIKATQEQQKMIEDLQKTVGQLKKQMEIR
jgi:hypothetical protein